jgi:hypothetical protein
MKAREVFEQIFRHPAPMRRLDDYLLKHYPQVWRLRVHYVLLYWSLAALALFIAGYLVPLDYYRCENYWYFYTVNSILPLTVIIFLFGLLSFINWRKKLRGIQQKSTFRWYVTLYEILLSCLCFFVFLLSVDAFTYGFDLKKHKVFARATAIINSEIFKSNNYFYPAYLPHFDSAKNGLSDEYFRHGEQLYGVLLQRYIQPSAPNYSHFYSATRGDEGFGILEAEAMTSSGIRIDSLAAIVAWDSIRLWGYMPYTLRNDFEQRLPHIPYLLAGMSLGDGLRFLEQARDTFTLSDADMVQIRRHYSDLNITHFGANPPEVGRGYRYSFLPLFEGRLFNYKCLLESLDSSERKAYHDYLAELMKLDLYDNEYGLYEIRQADSKSKDRIFQTFGESEGQLRDINQGLELLDNYIFRLDSVSVFWYKKYTEIFWSERDREEMYNYSYWFDKYKNYYSNIVSELNLNPTDTNRVRLNKALTERVKLLPNRLRTEFPKVTDSLLFFYPTQTQLYLNDLSSFYYDRYLDYYFRKHNTAILDTLCEYMAELGYSYPANWNSLDDNSRKTLLSDAMSFSKSYPELKKNIFDSDALDVVLHNPSTIYSKVFVAVLWAILFFFFCNTDMKFIIRGIFLGTIFQTILILARNQVAIYQILYPFLVFVALGTIVLLLILRHRTILLAISSQVILMAGMLLLIANPADEFGLTKDHFAYQNGKWYLLAFWCLLNIIIAILYRRHLTLPERS